MRMALQTGIMLFSFVAVASPQAQASALPRAHAPSAGYRDSGEVPTLETRQFLSGRTTYYGGSLELAAGTPVRLAIKGEHLDGFPFNGVPELVFSAPITDLSVTIGIPPSLSESWWEFWGSGKSAV